MGLQWTDAQLHGSLPLQNSNPHGLGLKRGLKLACLFIHGTFCNVPFLFDFYFLFFPQFPSMHKPIYLTQSEATFMVYDKHHMLFPCAIENNHPQA